jgi:uncharacterized protein YbjQ (UPF0145 family)
MDYHAFVVKIIFFCILFTLGLAFGRYNEQKHLKQLAEDEKNLSYITVDNQRFTEYEVAGQLVSSNVVISHDYFKYVIAKIHNFFGGRLKSYESILERARREAVVRLKKEAAKQGATHIAALRLSSSEMGMEGGMIEVFAYGTAVKK